MSLDESQAVPYTLKQGVLNITTETSIFPTKAKFDSLIIIPESNRNSYAFSYPLLVLYSFGRCHMSYRPLKDPVTS